jgi:hypothetical protein
MELIEGYIKAWSHYEEHQYIVSLKYIKNALSRFWEEELYTLLDFDDYFHIRRNPNTEGKDYVIVRNSTGDYVEEIDYPTVEIIKKWAKLI